MFAYVRYEIEITVVNEKVVKITKGFAAKNTLMHFRLNFKMPTQCCFRTKHFSHRSHFKFSEARTKFVNVVT